MTGTLLLVLTLAQNPQRSAAIDQIEIGVVATFVDGSTQTTSSVPGTRLVYASSGSVCDVPGTSAKEPGKTALGWKVNVEPIPGDARIGWSRLEATAGAQGGKNGIRVLPTAVRSEWTPLDHLDIPAAAGCKVLHWSLVARRTPFEVKPDSPARTQLMEAELWFVHKAPDGKETTQRQVIRMRGATFAGAGSQGEFYFDDMVINATLADRTEPVTVEVFGSLFPLPGSNENEMTIALALTRRYINPKAVAAGVPPTVGKGNHHLALTPGEVVSFVLPPLENDRGAFLGHRFSVRLRIKPLGPEGN